MSKLFKDNLIMIPFQSFKWNWLECCSTDRIITWQQQLWKTNLTIKHTMTTKITHAYVSHQVGVLFHIVKCQNPLIYVAVNISFYNFDYIIRRFNYISQLVG